MANAFYPTFLEAILATALTGTTVKAMAVNSVGGATQYTYSAAHNFVSDVASGAILARSGALASKTFVGGVLRADNLAPAFAALAGDPFELVILYIDTGSDATSRLLACYDTATGLPLTPDGTDVNINWGPSGIFGI